MYTPATTTVIQDNSLKWKWIALTIIITVLACSGVAVLAILAGPEAGRRSGSEDQSDTGSQGPETPPETTAAEIEPVGPGEYMVLVAQFEGLAGPAQPTRDVARFVAEDLQETLEQSIPFSNIRIRRYPQVITSDDMAQAVAAQYGATVMVWGNYAPDLIEAEVQIGVLDAFPYLKFPRDVIERTANIRLHLTNERTQSIAPQVLAVLNVLQVADGNGFEALRTGAIQDAIIVEPAEIVGSGVAAMVHRYFLAPAPEESYPHLEEALRLDTGNALLYAYSSITRLRRGDSAGAQRDAETAERLGPENWSSPRFLMSNMTDDAEVLKLFDTIIEQRPDDWFPLFFRGTSYYYNRIVTPDGMGRARADLDAAIALNPTASFPYVYRALIALHEGRLNDAWADMQVIHTRFPDPFYMERLITATFGAQGQSDYAYILSAFTNYVLGRYDAVLDTAEEGILAAPNLPDLRFLQGMSYCALSQSQAAKASFDVEMRIDPSFTLVHLVRGSAYLRLGEAGEAAKDFAAVTENDPAEQFGPYVAAMKARLLSCSTLFSADNPLLLDTTQQGTAAVQDAGEVRPGAVGNFLVLVAQIEPVGGVDERDVTRFVIDDLQRQFEQEIPNSGLEVRRYPEIITSDDQAREVAEANGATVIIWGTYSTEQVELEIQIGTTAAFEHLTFGREVLDRTANVRTTLTNEREQSIAPQVLAQLTVLAAADGDEYGVMGLITYMAVLTPNPAEVVGNSPAAGLNRALMLFSRDTAQAVTSLDAALANDSANPLLYVVRSLAHLRIGAFESALADLETARRLGPDAWALPLLLGAEADAETALDTYARVLELRPDDWFVYFLRGTFYYYGLQDFERARADLERSIEVVPQANLPYTLLLMIALREGRLDDAQTILNVMLTEYPDPELTNRAFEALYGEQRSHDVTGVFFASATNLALGQHDNVISDVAAVEEIVQQQPVLADEEGAHLADLLLLQGLAYCNLGDFAQAAQAYTNAIRFDSDLELTYLLRGQVRAALEDETGKQEDYAHAKVHVLGDDYDKWVESGIAGEWDCQTFLEFRP